MIKNLTAALLLLAACAREGNDAEGAQGVVELHERRLGFEQAGRLRERLAQRGQRVEAGQTLALLDDALERPQRDARAQDTAAAEAAFELVRSGTRTEDVRATEAQLRGARAAERTAQEQLARTRKLLAGHVVPQAQLDEAELQATRARSEREALEQRLAAQKHGARTSELHQAQARVESARAGVSSEDARLARFVLRAPAAGVILDTTAEPGEVLAVGAPVVVLGETRRPFVDVFIPQQDLAGVRVGAAAQVRIDAEPEPFHGTVADVGRTTEFAPRYLFSPRERVNLVVRVRIDVDDPGEKLHAGVPAFARLDRTAQPPPPSDARPAPPPPPPGPEGR